MARGRSKPKPPLSNRYTHYASYAIIEDDGETSEYYAVAPDLEKVKEFIEHKEDAKRDEGGRNLDIEVDETSRTPFGKQIWDSFKALHAYYFLSFFITDVLPNLGRARFSERVVKYASDNFAKVAEHKGLPIYGLTSDDMHRISDEMSKIDSMDRGTSRIRYSILLSIVATYDSLFVDCCKFLLAQNRERYEGSDRTYSVSEILNLKSIDEIIERVIEDELDQLMSKSHRDQMEFFAKNFHVKVESEGDKWASYIEIFERRNLAAHGNLVINDRYLENCTKAGCKNLPDKGSIAHISARYVESSLDVLIEFLISSMFRAWRKRERDQAEDAFNLMIEMTFELLKDGHANIAVNLCRFVLDLKDSGLDLNSKQYLIVNQAIGLRLLKRIDEAHALLDTSDFSAASSLVKLGVASLKNDVGAACALLEPAKIADNLTILSLKTWPVFQWIVKEREFSNKAEQVYGEGFVVEEQQGLIASPHLDDSADGSTPTVN